MVRAKNTGAFPCLVFMFPQAGTEGLKSPAELTVCNSKLRFILLTAKVCVHEDLN